jgi:hypothetical protein
MTAVMVYMVAGIPRGESQHQVLTNASLHYSLRRMKDELTEELPDDSDGYKIDLFLKMQRGNA